MKTVKISKIMKIKFLTIIGVLFLVSFGNEVKAQEGTYYFAWANIQDNNGNYTGHIFITPVLFTECDIPHGHYISKQFHDYIESEYNLSYDVGQKAFFRSKTEAVESRRKIMSQVQRITKINDFEYLCD